MRRYAIVDYFGYDLSPMERMRAIKAAGFDSVILLWADYFDPDYQMFPEYARRAGLFVENAHAPYKYANAVWEDGPEGDEYAAHIVRCVNECAQNGVPTLVVHPINGRTPLPEGGPGIERFKHILDAAQARGVDVAMENQGNPEYIDHVFRNIISDRLRFCFDSGHERFYSPERDLLAEYGSRLAALHLHDNDGTDDAHMLPFTGKVDWMRVKRRLTECDYQGAIALETLNRGFEHVKDPVEFLGIALERAKEIF